MEKCGSAYLEVTTDRERSRVRIGGENVDIIFAWMHLTASVAEAVHTPLSHLLAQCSILGPEFEKLNHTAEVFRIDLSRPSK